MTTDAATLDTKVATLRNQFFESDWKERQEEHGTHFTECFDFPEKAWELVGNLSASECCAIIDEYDWDDDEDAPTAGELLGARRDSVNDDDTTLQALRSTACYCVRFKTTRQLKTLVE